MGGVKIVYNSDNHKDMDEKKNIFNDEYSSEGFYDDISEGQEYYSDVNNSRVDCSEESGNDYRTMDAD